MNIRLIHALRASAAALLIGLSACGGGGDGGISGTGVMRLSLTDAPACGYDQVNVTIQKVRVHQSSDAADSAAGWSEVVLNPARRIDLLTLTNGVLDVLGQTSLPAGRYTQMRLVLADNAGGPPFANSVVPTGGAEVALTTPSAQQSGLKFNVNMDVAANQVADFVIDFDACKSVVKRGNSGQYNLKPVISVTPLLSDAGLRVIGYVDTSIANGSTTVSVQQAGLPVKATVPLADGRFELYPVPVGSYDLVIGAAGRVTAVMTGVPVGTTSVTTVNSTSFAFLPAPSTTATVTGTVTPTAATVRALQTLSGGPTVEVAWAAVDADTGVFQATLPTQAPVKTAYVPAATSAYTFTPDAVAGQYTLEAAYAGVTQTQSVNTGSPTATISFSFP
jgi:hypothetical protein